MSMNRNEERSLTGAAPAPVNSRHAGRDRKSEMRTRILSVLVPGGPGPVMVLSLLMPGCPTPGRRDHASDTDDPGTELPPAGQFMMITQADHHDDDAESPRQG